MENKKLSEETKADLISNIEDMIDTIMEYTETNEERKYVLELFRKGLSK